MSQTVELVCHPSKPSDAVRAVVVRVGRNVDGELRLSFRLDGDIERIRFAPPGAPRFAAELWRHTCFEVFISREGHHAYHEFNFATSGEWTVYSFSDYRNGGAVDDEALRPEIEARATASHIELDALVRLGRLSAAHIRTSLRLGLAAIIEASDGFSYWALSHPAGKPDFHDHTSLAMLLAPPAAE